MFRERCGAADSGDFRGSDMGSRCENIKKAEMVILNNPLAGRRKWQCSTGRRQRKCSKKTRALMRLHHVGMLGKHHSEETKAKMRGKRKGTVLPPEWHQNMILAHKSEEYRRKMRELRLGKKLLEATKRKIGDGVLKAWAAGKYQKKTRQIDICRFLGRRRVHNICQCLYYPENCLKKSSIVCPTLEIELKHGEQIDRERLEKRIGDMAPWYFRLYYLSLPQGMERGDALEIYAKLHNYPVQTPDHREKLVLMIRSGQQPG